MVRHLVLASASVRRIKLLKKFVDNLVVVSPNYVEVLLDDPVETVYRNSRGKVYSVLDSVSRDSIVIGVDTVVYHPSFGVIGKPSNLDDAREILRKLNGRIHSVYSGVYIVDKSSDRETFFYVVTHVKFHRLNHDEIEEYVASGEPLGKAGAYAIQERGMLFIEWIMGDFYNVVGLPISRLYRVLKSVYGFDLFRGK